MLGPRYFGALIFPTLLPFPFLSFYLHRSPTKRILQILRNALNTRVCFYQDEVMRSFFSDAAANIRAATINDDDHRNFPSQSSKADCGLSGACFDIAAVDPSLYNGRNGPANGSSSFDSGKTVGAARVNAERTLANLRDAAQQLGVRHLAAAAAAELGHPTSRGKAGTLPASTAARLLWEVRRAEASWSAADCSGTTRAVASAVSTIVPAGAVFRPMSGALQFHRASGRA